MMGAYAGKQKKTVLEALAQLYIFLPADSLRLPRAGESNGGECVTRGVLRMCRALLSFVPNAC